MNEKKKISLSLKKKQKKVRSRSVKRASLTLKKEEALEKLEKTAKQTKVTNFFTKAGQNAKIVKL